MNIEVEGIVLKKVPYKEKDEMVSILSKDGIISFIARGIASSTSKNAASCNLFSTSIFTINEKNDKKSLTQGKVIDSHYQIYSSLKNMAAVQLISEATLRFMDEDNKEMYSFFNYFLRFINENYDSNTLISIYLANLIKYSGYALSYNECSICGSKTNIVSVDYENGGFICKNCYNFSKTEDENYLNSYRYCFMIEANRMDYHVIENDISLRLINEFVSYLCLNFDIKELKSFDLYKKSL